MENQTVANIETAISYIEEHLDRKLDLDEVAEGVHFSKYYLHRMFTSTVGMTIHDYSVRRRLTEAAKLLVFSERPVIEIALTCGYESQQSFTAAFKSMYKFPPAKYRERREFYPLQLRFSLHREMDGTSFSKDRIRAANMDDIPAWMELVSSIIDGFPCLNEEQYGETLINFIQMDQALIIKHEDTAIGVMCFSYETGNIEFLGIHPQYRNCGLQKDFLDKLMGEYLPGHEISITTYREGDRADTGYRKQLKQLGFAERELLLEFGYPTQRFVLPPIKQEVHSNAENISP
ncbi:helix-turn-helix domain-containing protein [Clostridium sp. MCC353]|uniref:helix-turn-helix domain-containing protein n=1 Tax=Clostridium sp. MCC353 TaxID=2592646 RepID=UPI001C02335D|nr:helix-turn-helix domain-containing protein [Clostridium sp. MCC353]